MMIILTKVEWMALIGTDFVCTWLAYSIARQSFHRIKPLLVTIERHVFSTDWWKQFSERFNSGPVICSRLHSIDRVLNPCTVPNTNDKQEFVPNKNGPANFHASIDERRNRSTCACKLKNRLAFPPEDFQIRLCSICFNKFSFVCCSIASIGYNSPSTIFSSLVLNRYTAPIKNGNAILVPNKNESTVNAWQIDRSSKFRINLLENVKTKKSSSKIKSSTRSSLQHIDILWGDD